MISLKPKPAAQSWLATNPMIRKKKSAYLFLANFCLLLALFTSTKTARAQEINPTLIRLTIEVTNEPLSNVLSLIEKQTTFRFAYSTDLVRQQKNISLTLKDVSLKEVLETIFLGTSITYTIIDNQIILQKLNFPDKITISGYTNDNKSGESLIGTSIFLPASKKGTVSNKYGFYSITVIPSDSMELIISYVGYKTISKTISAKDNIRLNLNLVPVDDPIITVTIVNDKKEDYIKRNQVDLLDLSSEMIATTPAVSGSGDLLSSIQLLPGVQTGMDGTPGYFVRGGNADQNLVQLDEATLYNPNHLFGLVSVFNFPAVKKASLLKGAFPASYGDYLSSILDVSMKDGSNQLWGGHLQMGTVVSGLTLYGPVKTGKASYLISARRSTIDQVLRPFNVKNYFSDYYFYDLNGKVNYKLSPGDQIFLSYYRGSDKGAYTGHNEEDDEEDIHYNIAFGNQAMTLRWNHIYSRKLFSNTSVIYGNYFQRLTAIQEQYFAQLYSGIRDVNFKTDLYYYPRLSHRIRGGLNILNQTLYPATVSDKVSTTGFVNIRQKDIPHKTAYRFAIYLSDDIKIGRKFNLYAGVRLPVFKTTQAQYINTEPRVSLLYLLNSTTSIKAAYTEMHQYIHLVQSYNASFPAELWIGSSNIVKPQSSRQVSAGLFKSFKNNRFQIGLEFYHKQMEHQLLFKGGTQPTIDANIESRLIFGQATSYGSEVIFKKNTGKFRGWLGYSLSQAFQQFDSLNKGKQFSFANNRKHNLYLSSTYNFRKHWEVSANLFLASGRSFTNTTKTTTPQSNQDDNPLFEEDDDYVDPGNNLQETEPNNYRLTPYNRLDLSLSYRYSGKTRNRTLESAWVLSVYNAYASNNTSFVYRSIDPVTKQPVVKEVSFIPIIPSISYHLKF